MLQTKKAVSLSDIRSIHKMAWDIYLDEYPYIPEEHTRFFLEKFQSIPAITKQINTNFEYFIFYWNNHLAGYLGLEKENNCLVLSKIYLYKAYRGKGIGKKGLEITEEFAKKYNYKKVELTANQDNKNAIEFYTQHGYQAKEKVVHHFENGHAVNDLIMEKSI